ncbi:GNAT family N-acetyltransferase [Pseudomonas sp. LPB0260]|uniref:GNAT family N-acetyltransferase n=1 Tax=Pseudomonas sp. LPB0260 TaxID=2614442 RepID=UPI0015C2B733|nr:GNAT family N-acetyltransferase [Pseudomonas sp. LPB0260]QLC73346.1 GNAT family N-acetyltransferase [Pseudomonas sp. LPB0260]QLC76120.1 GNAT family N-acetyltransferase [Pseudomonas sp. LPB0260]
MRALRFTLLSDIQHAAALDLLDTAFARDPTIGWFLFRERPGFDQRRRSYLAAYQRFHHGQALPALAAWKDDHLLGVSYFSLGNEQPEAASSEALGMTIREQCGEDCLARLDHLLETFNLQGGSPGVARIEFIAVAPEHRGQGLGGLLLNHTLSHCKLHGSLAVALETGEPRNLPLYHRLGFQRSADLHISGLHQHYLQLSWESGSR